MQAGLLEHIKTFVRSVETGSFTQVAQEQGQSQPTVSRQISALEDHLGVRLLQRTTRALTLTEEGRSYYAHALRLLDAAEEAAMAVRPGAAQVSGLLRIAAPMAFARLHLMSRLKPFLENHPDLTTEWVLGDRAVDLVEDGLDVAIRIGEVTDQTVIARKIGQTRRRVVASNRYLEGRRAPVTPSELTQHDCIVYTGLATRDLWTFRKPPAPDETVRVSGAVSVSASEGVRAAVLEGFGIALCPTWLFTDEIETGQLIPLLEDYEPSPLDIHVVMPSRRLISPRVRAFVDFIAEALRDDAKLSLPSRR